MDKTRNMKIIASHVRERSLGVKMGPKKIPCVPTILLLPFKVN
jgi:hypothetical protein